jgi:hypothetical protein
VDYSTYGVMWRLPLIAPQALHSFEL